MKASEVMHHYIGAKVQVEEYLCDDGIAEYQVGGVYMLNAEMVHNHYLGIGKHRLQLREEEDMTEGERGIYESKKKVETQQYFASGKHFLIDVFVDTAESIHYKCSIGVDCFGLLKSGEADHNSKIYGK